jgi:ferredoxin
MDCLKLVPAHQLHGEVVEVELGQVSYGPQATAMLLDPTRCIRCGLCAARCPTEAVVMNSFRLREQVVFEGAA